MIQAKMHNAIIYYSWGNLYLFLKGKIYFGDDQHDSKRAWESHVIF